MIIGIDLGTTNSLAAYFKDGKAMIIPNRLKKNLTPSVVAVDDKAQILVGETAKEYGMLHPEHAAEVFKRFMGSERQYDLGGHKFRAALRGRGSSASPRPQPSPPGSTRRRRAPAFWCST